MVQGTGVMTVKPYTEAEQNDFVGTDRDSTAAEANAETQLGDMLTPTGYADGRGTDYLMLFDV